MSVPRSLCRFTRLSRNVPLSMSRTKTAHSQRLFSGSVVRRAATQPPLTTFTEDEEIMRESVARWAQETVAPKVLEMDEAEVMDPKLIKGLFEQGLMGIEVPAEYGGSEASFTTAIIAIEELAKVDPSISVMADVHNTLVNTAFKTYGSKALKEKYLPQLATEKLGSFCLSEPASGSDAFALKTRAEKTADGYKLNGSKMWVTNAADAGIFLIFANLDPSKGYKGITCFVAEKEWGVQIAKKEKKLGIRASSTCLLHLDDLHIPKQNILGTEGQGYKIAIEVLNEGRIGIAAQMTGLAMGSFDRAISYCLNDRKQFGKAIGEFQGMQFQFAQEAMEIEAARLLVYNAARLKEAGMPFVKEAAFAKLYGRDPWTEYPRVGCGFVRCASQVAQKVSGASIEQMGGVGFTRELGIEKYWRDSKIGAIYEGTSNIQMETIFRQLKKQYGTQS